MRLERAGVPTESEGEQWEEEEEDFETWWETVEDSGLYHQAVVTNQLLGIIVAAMIAMMIFGVMKFIIRLVSDNITNYF